MTWTKIIQHLNLQNSSTIPNGIQSNIGNHDDNWILSIQYFEQYSLLYIAINNYLWLDHTPTAQRSVFLMTQLLIENHNMVGGKFQINPQNGAITIGIELPIHNQISLALLEDCIQRLLQLAENKYPLLLEAQGSQHY